MPGERLPEDAGAALPVPIRDRYAAGRLEILAALNADRAAAGLAPVVLDSLATVAAQGHAEAMAREGFFSHYDRAGRAPYDRLAAAGGAYHVRENVFRWQERGGDPLWTGDPWPLFEPRAAQEWLMGSPPHRDAILDPHRTGVGLGIAVDPARRAVVVVQDLVARHAALAAAAGPGLTARLEGRVLDPAQRPLMAVVTREPAGRIWAGGKPPPGPYEDGTGPSRVVPPWAFEARADGRFRAEVGSGLAPGRYYAVLYVAPAGEVERASARRRASTDLGWPAAAVVFEVGG